MPELLSHPETEQVPEDHSTLLRRVGLQKAVIEKLGIEHTKQYDWIMQNGERMRRIIDRDPQVQECLAKNDLAGAVEHIANQFKH
jgi:hypothetical protein